MLIKDNPRISMNAISLRSKNIKKLKVFSNIAASTVLDRAQKGDFSFPPSGIITIKNLTEESGFMELKCDKSSAGLVMHSSRRATATLTEGRDVMVVLCAGEALTVHSLDHQPPKNAPGPPVAKALA
jgi:hypothetical protein